MVLLPISHVVIQGNPLLWAGIRAGVHFRKEQPRVNRPSTMGRACEVPGTLHIVVVVKVPMGPSAHEDAMKVFCLWKDGQGTRGLRKLPCQMKVESLPIAF